MMIPPANKREKMSTLPPANSILTEERRKQDEQIRDTIMAKLIETGEKDRIKEYLRERLAASGWQDNLKEIAKEVIRKKGTERISIEELVNEVIPHGRGILYF